ncbi:DNA ligase [Halarcobacter ebronensis]
MFSIIFKRLTMKYIILSLLSIFSFAIELQHPQIYKNNENINTWVMSEKLDGIRAYWDGKQFLTRKGKVIYVPKWFIKNFPNFELDGELYTKRDDFENIQSIVLDKNPSKKWEEITYNIFEIPNAKGDFYKRLEKAKNWFEKNPNEKVKIIEQKKVKNEENLNSFFNEIVLNKGEGVIVKDPSKEYQAGRTPFVLKMKNAQDMEGEVIDINISEKTKVLKSLVIKLENGITFNLGGGFTKEQRENPPKIGEIVTFKYFGFTKNGKPKFASFLHIRKD